MKKIKFTLGFALVILFTGANFVNAELVERDNTIKRDGDNIFDHTIKVGLTINASPYYANSTSVSSFSGDNDAFSGDLYSNFHNYYGASFLFGSKDIRTNTFDLFTEYGSGYYHYYLNYEDFDKIVIARDTTELYHYGTIKLRYDNGVDIMPFVKMKIVCGKWMYDTVDERHYMVPTHTIESQISPQNVSKKTDFTFGTGIATYDYEVDILQLFDKEPLIYSIHYDVWVDDMFGGNDEGPGYGDKYTNYAVVINAAPGIATNPATDIITPKYVQMGTSFTFDVSGDPGKELEVTSSDYLWTVDNGGIIITPDGVGKWKVTLYKVASSMTVKVGYKTVVESGETGNVAFTADAVWASAGTLYVKAATPGILSIYSATGQLYKQFFAFGDYTATLPKGLYIVQLNGKTYKVVL